MREVAVPTSRSESANWAECRVTGKVKPIPRPIGINGTMSPFVGRKPKLNRQSTVDGSMGMLMQKTQRQVVWSTMKIPREGPRKAAMTNVPVKNHGGIPKIRSLRSVDRTTANPTTFPPTPNSKKRSPSSGLRAVAPFEKSAVGREQASPTAEKLGPKEQEFLLEGSGRLFERGSVRRPEGLGIFPRDPGKKIMPAGFQDPGQLGGVRPPQFRRERVITADVDQSPEKSSRIGQLERIGDPKVDVQIGALGAVLG
jgi:hypothetical protein